VSAIAEVAELQEAIRAGETLPDWTPVQWAIMASIKMGDVSMRAAVVEGMDDPNDPLTGNDSDAHKLHMYRETLKAACVVLLDALEQAE
jgi:hypothetical protein